MAGELAYDTTTGKLVYSPATGQLALNCATGEPCEDCAEATPGATVTVSGCSEPACLQFAGSYTFTDFVVFPAGGCAWFAEQPDMQLGIYYKGDWWVNLVQIMGGHVYYQTGTLPEDAIKCADGKLSGTIEIPGNPYWGCSGCTATVTLT